MTRKQMRQCQLVTWFNTRNDKIYLPKGEPEQVLPPSPPQEPSVETLLAGGLVVGGVVVLPAQVPKPDWHPASQ